MLASYDIIVVGGGPAGLAAAIYGRRAEKSVLVLEKNGFGGQIAWSPKVDNFPGVPEVSGAELADRMFSQALGLGADAELAEVTAVSPAPGGFTVSTPDGDYAAKAVVLATGAQHRKLGVDREDELAGNGVCYCAVCDGAFYKDRPVAVAGGGDAALQDALLLANVCSQVYIIHRRDEFRAEAANVRAVLSRGNITCLMNSRVVALEGEGELSGIVVEDKATLERRSIAVDGLFVAVGYEAAKLLGLGHSENLLKHVIYCRSCYVGAAHMRPATQRKSTVCGKAAGRACPAPTSSRQIHIVPCRA